MASIFPHLTATGPPPTSGQVMDAYREAFKIRIADHSLRPLVLPYHFYGYIILGLYLCIPHTKQPWIYTTRWLVLAGILAFQWKTTWEVTSMSMATGFAAGLMAAWGAVWAVTWLVLYRPQFDAKRVQARPRIAERVVIGNTTHSNGAARISNGKVITTNVEGKQEKQVPANDPARNLNGNGFIRMRQSENRYGKREENGCAVSSKDHPKVDLSPLDFEPGKDDADEVEYYWESYPPTFNARFWWVSDLIINFRLPGWNLSIPPLPPLLRQFGESNSQTTRTDVSSVGLIRYPTRRALLRGRLPEFIIGYLVLDILKVCMMKDPYFIFGPTTYALPSPLSILPSSILAFYRQLLSSASIIVSLEMIFLIPPLLLSLLLGPSILGLRAHAIYYPSTWGALSNIATKGLNGLWGSWWHQTFRFAFSAPSNYLIANKYIQAHSTLARVSALFFAFAISGILHSGGSISQFPSTYFSHAPIFFMLQALGIVIQSTACAVFALVLKRVPRRVRMAGNVVFTFLWLWNTGAWLTDDFARGGIWLYEPIPVSPLRAMGLGERDAGWWCWEHIGVGWYRGNYWWESGIAL
jgi:hypothetical protein